MHEIKMQDEPSKLELTDVSSVRLRRPDFFQLETFVM